MVRDRQKLLGRFVIETTYGHEQEVRVIGEGSRVMFDYPYNHIVVASSSIVGLSTPQGGSESRRYCSM